MCPLRSPAGGGGEVTVPAVKLSRKSLINLNKYQKKGLEMQRKIQHFVIPHLRFHFLHLLRKRKFLALWDQLDHFLIDIIILIKVWSILKPSRNIFCLPTFYKYSTV